MKAELASRLITKNLLSSAAHIERSRHPSWSSIQDLSALIDIFCLYDTAVVLSTDGKTFRTILERRDSQLIDLFRSTNFVAVGEGEKSLDPKVRLTAAKHLVTFLGGRDAERFGSLVNDIRYGDAYGLEDHRGRHFQPDTPEQLISGKEWIVKKLKRRELREAMLTERGFPEEATFFLRTFLYLGYADAMRVTFTPDIARSSVARAILRVEEEFRVKAINRIRQQWEDYPDSSDAELQRRVSPLAAVVFDRAYPDKTRIVPEIHQLRLQLEPFRERIRKTERQILYGTRDNAVKARLKWDQVFEEISKSFGKEPQLITIRRAIDFSRPVAGISAQPSNYKSWVDALLGLPFEVLSRVLDRGPAIELHRLRKKLPATGALRNALHGLFGDLDPD